MSSNIQPFPDTEDVEQEAVTEAVKAEAEAEAAAAPEVVEEAAAAALEVVEEAQAAEADTAATPEVVEEADAATEVAEAEAEAAAATEVVEEAAAPAPEVASPESSTNSLPAHVRFNILQPDELMAKFMPDFAKLNEQVRETIHTIDKVIASMDEPDKPDSDDEGAGAGAAAGAGAGAGAGEERTSTTSNKKAKAAGKGSGSSSSMPAPYLCSVMMVAKGEQPYIREFVHYYRMIGMDHIFIYDNASEGERLIEDTLTDKEREFCTVVRFPGKAMQKHAYLHFIDNHSHLTEWVLVVDGDEFLVLHQHGSIGEFLDSRCRRVFGVGVNWYMFGFGDTNVWPRDKLVIESYTRGSPNHHIKTLARTAILRTLKAKRGHKLDCIHNLFGICQQLDGKLIQKPWNPSRSDAECISLYHYWTKSVEEFEGKLQRGRATLNCRRDRGEAYAHAAEIQKETNTYMVDVVVPKFLEYLQANGITKQHLTETHYV